MTPTSEERIEIAARLREAAIDDGHVGRPYGEQGFQVTLRRIIGTSNPMRPTLYVRLADLIDPTCEVDSIEPVENVLGQTVGYEFHLTCGHSVTQPYIEAPAHCDECGARVVKNDGID